MENKWKGKEKKGKEMKGMKKRTEGNKKNKAEKAGLGRENNEILTPLLPEISRQHAMDHGTDEFRCANHDDGRVRRLTHPARIQVGEKI